MRERRREGRRRWRRRCEVTLPLNRYWHKNRPLRVSLSRRQHLRRRYRTPPPPSFALPLPLSLLRPVRLCQRERARRVLSVDTDVENAGLPSVAVVGCDGEVGVAGGGKEDDAETSRSAVGREMRRVRRGRRKEMDEPVGRRKSDVCSKNGSAFSHQIFLRVGRKGSVNSWIGRYLESQSVKVPV